jgi:hypothetical protein
MAPFSSCQAVFQIRLLWLQQPDTDVEEGRNSPPLFPPPHPITTMAKNPHRWKIIKRRRGGGGNLRARGTMFQLASSYLYEISSGLIESVLVGKTQQPGMNQNKVNVYSSRKVFLIDIQQPKQPEQEQRPRQALVFIH